MTTKPTNSAANSSPLSTAVFTNIQSTPSIIPPVPATVHSQLSFLLKPTIFPQSFSTPLTLTSANQIPTTIPTMSAHKSVSGMPSPTLGKAPSFTGVKTKLLDFLKLFEDLASSNGLADEEKCKNIAIPLETSQTSRRVSWQNSGLSTKTELMEYYYDFLLITTWLVDNKKISKTQHDQYFWERLPALAQTAIDHRLELKLADYSRDEPPAFEKVLKAGQFVFPNNASNADNPLTAHL
ncbi:hypothetical protein K503DRAFT_787830 [Rhizopogon vinicolor AM-OR11-026]|uniref:Uncharacterized protein n=1 Tax=Rhizopogon vinicolor AM-OR11-026 TaxID=1314800 RepID=A0A1B7MFP8_9AGAM|nr:hypothetical protein K503DRAFT_787830 [Rhizopogon vinicolor AM-OR11-026]